jgi:hypothetical protein
MVESTSSRHSLSEARNGNPFSAQKITQVAGRGLTFDIRTYRQNDFLSL